MCPDDMEDLKNQTPEQETIPDTPGEEIEEPEPEFECGIAIRLGLNGQGISMGAISNECSREATPDDFIMLIGAAYSHMTTNLAAMKTANILMQQAQAQKTKIVNPKFGIRPR
jgi:hypothetical protein